MNKFEFVGDWSFNAQFNTFSKIDSEYWHSYVGSLEHTELLGQELVPLMIIDKQDYDPDPLPEQIEAINFLFSNESGLIDVITKYFVDKVNPYYAKACGDHDWIPSDLNSNNLGELLRIYSILISSESHSGAAYIIFEFDYRGDEEHGISIVFNKMRPIGFSDRGDLGFDIIHKDLADEESKNHDKSIEDSQHSSNIVHKPLEKYGKFKPWQLDATEDYFRKLLWSKDNDKVIEEINSNKWNINLRFPSLNNNLVDLAAYGNNVEAINYLIKNGADFSKSILECSDYYIQKEAIKCLLSHGANIDELNRQYVTPLHSAIFYYVNALSKNREKEIEKYKSKIQFYVSVGSNPQICDKYNNDYKAVLRERWTEEFLIDNDIFNKLEVLLFPNMQKQMKWKFWK